MKKSMGACALVVSLVLAIPSAHGSGWGSSCAPTACVTYVDQVVTAYRPVYKEVLVQGTANELVSRVVETPYKYTEMVAVTTPTKQVQTFYTQVAKQVPYTYTETVPVVTPTKQVQTFYTQVAKQVPYTYNVTVPVVTPTKQVQTFYTPVATEVVVNVPVCTMVPCQAVDACGHCYTTCKPVTTMQPVKKVVYQNVPQQREVMVNVCTYTTVQKQGSYTVCELVPQQREVMVNVCSYNTVQKQGSYTVCELVPQQREVMVNVVSYQPTERTGVSRSVVCDVVQKQVTYKQVTCEMAPYQYTVKVPVCAPAAPVCCK
jgi:hypothetical protein